MIKLTLIAAGFLAICGPLAQDARGQQVADALAAQPVPNRLGLTLNEFAFSWSWPDGHTRYQILVASDEPKLSAGVGDLWDSGARHLAHGQDRHLVKVIYRGLPLRDGVIVWWKVRTWAGTDPSEEGWSAPAVLEVPGRERDGVRGAEEEGNGSDRAQINVRNRIVTLGGTWMHELENHGLLEAAVTARWPHHDITFRNLGWPADDVFGTAWSEFGSAQNTRSWKPPGAEAGFGYRERAKQIEEAQPTTILVGYGAEAAFADTAERMKDFENGYRTLIEDLADTGATLVLLTPILQRAHGGVLLDPTDRNARLVNAADVILQVGKVGGHAVIDLAREEDLWGGEEDPDALYRNGVHLDERGLSLLGSRLAEATGVGLGAFHPLLRSDEKTGAVGVAIQEGVVWEPVATRRGHVWDARLDQLPLTSGSVRGWEGRSFELTIDGIVANAPDHRGRHEIIHRGPDFDQAEALREAIVLKNRFHHYKLRPINKTYIFLFRRHEMGHLADELKDLDERISLQERLIANLRVPGTHTYHFERREPWKPPRDYPDHEVPKDIPEPDVKKELAAFTVAEGFEVNLFASDPMIANPINLNWDSRGRAWVSTSTTYPHIKPGSIPNDRIVILEDEDGDGVADRHKVFAEGLTVPHSVMPVKGGAYVCSSTEFLFLEDRDGDDVSESRRVIFSGFGNADVHHMIHGLRWAPWGDLHFTQSIYINTFIETAHGPRRMNGSGVWRFRPERESLDAFAVGRVNPWGFAFDPWGQAFGTDGAGGNGPHYIFPGSAHGTAVGAHRVLDGLIPGRPKNTAAEFVSGRHLPDHWQGSLLANDFRANRTVRYALQEEESGSGYQAREVETVLHSSHRSFRPVDIKMGPEGAVYVVDWYNPIIDHGEVDFHHPLRDKSHGRIWRITAKDRPLAPRPKVAGATVPALLDELKSPEHLTRVQANRELASRSGGEVMERLAEWVKALDLTDPNVERHRLEALWLLQARGDGWPSLLQDLLRSSSHQARAAAVRALANWQPRAGEIDRLAMLEDVISDDHPRVRLEAIHALRALGTHAAANVALRALDSPTDPLIEFALELTVRELRDQWLPVMQAGKRVFDGDPMRLAYALKEVNDARAMASLVEVVKRGDLSDEELPAAVATIAAIGEPTDIDAILELAVEEPSLLEAIAQGASNGGGMPTDPGAVLPFLKSDRAATRIAALRVVRYWRVSEAVPHLHEFAERDGLEWAAACRAFAVLGDAAALKNYASANQPMTRRAVAIAAWAAVAPVEASGLAVDFLLEIEDGDAVEPLVQAYLTHDQGPSALAGALEGKELAESVAVTGVRLARASGREVDGLITALHRAGNIKRVDQDLSSEERQVLLKEASRSGDFERGREVFQRSALACQTCHVIENEGGKLGPDLTTVGAYMTPESLLDSLLNPSASIKQGYETVIITRKDDTIVSGLLQRKADGVTLIRDPSGEVVSIPNREIVSSDTSPISLMPPGLTAQLTRDELVDLMKYLTSLGEVADGG